MLFGSSWKCTKEDEEEYKTYLNSIRYCKHCGANMDVMHRWSRYLCWPCEQERRNIIAKSHPLPLKEGEVPDRSHVKYGNNNVINKNQKLMDEMDELNMTADEVIEYKKTQQKFEERLIHEFYYMIRQSNDG